MTWIDELQRALSSPASTRAPEWTGLVVLGTIIALFALATWWLFFSPLERPVRASRVTERVWRVRRALAALILLGGTLMTIGTRWDELWHRMYGGFGNDFLWPPHLMMYGALGLNGIFAGAGLAVALRGRGGLRQRFRAEPLMGLLGLLAAYQIASIPSDLLWHKIIGPDLTAWSLPHVLLMVTVSAVLWTGIAVAQSTLPDRSWRASFDWPSGMELVSLGLVVVSALSMLQIGTTEWEWTKTAGGGSSIGLVLTRPSWAYPVVVLLLGVVYSHLSIYVARRVGAATLVALAVLALQLLSVVVFRAVLPPGPIVASHLLILAPAVVLDTWYAAGRRSESLLGQWAIAAIQAAVFFAIAFPYMARSMAAPSFDAAGRAVTLAIGLPVALLAAPAAIRVAEWLATVGRPHYVAMTKSKVAERPASVLWAGSTRRGSKMESLAFRGSSGK